MTPSFLSKIALQRSATWLVVLLVSFSLACDEQPVEAEQNTGETPVFTGGGGKGDELFERDYEVILTDPFCDECSAEDRSVLQANSQIVERVVDLIDNAEGSVHIAQFTFSVRAIEDAIYRAVDRGIDVKVAMDMGQNRSGSLSSRLVENGVNVRFVRGNQVGNQDRYGLMHSKFMIVDGHILLTGSNNWSSTGTSINEENTIVMTSTADDFLIQAFACHFDAAWQNSPGSSGNCSIDEARFSPGIHGRDIISDNINRAERSVDVLMHHFLFDNVLRDLADAAERGVKVRVVLNYEDRHNYEGGDWDRIMANGGELRFKRNNTDAFQYMHHKLAIVDGRNLLHGSGNWSGSGFFNNFEFYVRYQAPEVVDPFIRLFERLWDWSLNSDTIERGHSAARQHHAGHQVFFGNLHAHYEKQGEDGKFWDDGELLRRHGSDGDFYSVEDEMGDRHVARYAFEYARDIGKMDFMALSPHVVEDREDDAMVNPNLTIEGYARIVDIARQVTQESGGEFVAIPSMEWNTTSAGNHVNIFGTDTLAKVERGRFDLLYEDFLPARVADGERPLLQFNHPRTFRQNDSLSGNWDQIYGVNLQEITSDSQRSVKFNDFGLNDYPPLNGVIDSWIAGEAMPDPEVVSETLTNIEEVTRPYLRMMEVTIGRGTDIAHEDGENPSWVERNDEAYHYTRVESDWHYYLLQGFHLAPTANHDNHYANWGSGHSTRTAIIAPELNERALLDGIDRRLVYASEDEHLAVGFYADGRIPMGSQMGTTRNHVNLNLYFEHPDYTGNYEVQLHLGRIGDNEVEKRTHMTNVRGNRWHGLTVPLSTAGDYFVYVSIYKVGTQRTAWTAPIWITRY